MTTAIIQVLIGGLLALGSIACFLMAKEDEHEFEIPFCALGKKKNTDWEKTLVIRGVR